MDFKLLVSSLSELPYIALEQFECEEGQSAYARITQVPEDAEETPDNPLALVFTLKSGRGVDIRDITDPFEVILREDPFILIMRGPAGTFCVDASDLNSVGLVRVPPPQRQQARPMPGAGGPMVMPAGGQGVPMTPEQIQAIQRGAR